MLCTDNWIDISWDGLPLRKQKENLQVKFHHRANLMPFDKACDQVAQEIYNSHKTLYLAFSGGCDSENIANVLYRNHIPFVPVILIYDNVLDQRQKLESWYAIKWCKSHGIVPEIVHSKNFIGSIDEKLAFLKIRPRLLYGSATTAMLDKFISQRAGSLIIGNQLEYYPDHEQMTYLEPQLADYHGFVMQETDFYFESLTGGAHPWAFYYWNPEIMAAFVNEWNPSMTMQENKAAIYKVTHRPKIAYPCDLLPKAQANNRRVLASRFGSLDVALLGSKQTLLEKLLK